MARSVSGRGARPKAGRLYHVIRSELDVLLDKIEDSALRADLQSQIDRLKQRRSFGLVFELHVAQQLESRPDLGGEFLQIGLRMAFDQAKQIGRIQA